MFSSSLLPVSQCCNKTETKSWSICSGGVTLKLLFSFKLQLTWLDYSRLDIEVIINFTFFLCIPFANDSWLVQTVNLKSDACWPCAMHTVGRNDGRGSKRVLFERVSFVYARCVPRRKPTSPFPRVLDWSIVFDVLFIMNLCAVCHFYHFASGAESICPFKYLQPHTASSLRSTDGFPH